MCLVLAGASVACADVLEVFLDPYCPYCKKVLENHSVLNSQYELEVVWSPILGSRSEERVRKMFFCTEPAGTQVVEAVIKKESFNCAGEFNELLWQKNYDRYQEVLPNSVPYMLLDGRSVSWGELRRNMSSGAVVESVVPQVRLTWARYESFLISDDDSKRDINEALVFIKNKPAWSLKEQVKSNQEYVWYWVEEATNPEKYEELSLLLNADAVQGSFLLLDGQIRPLSELQNN